MKTLLIVLLLLGLTSFVYAQDPCTAYTEVDLELCRDLDVLETEKASLLKQQQDWNNASANARRSVYNEQILRWELKIESITDKPRLVQHLQDKIDRLTLIRDEQDRTGVDEEKGESERYRATQLGPAISDLSQLIGQIKAELGIE